MKLIELLKVNDSMKRLSKILLPNAKDNIRVCKCLMEINPYVENFYIQRNKIIEKYGTRSDDEILEIKENDMNYNNCISEIVEHENVEIHLNFEKLETRIDSIELNGEDLYLLVNVGIVEMS